MVAQGSDWFWWYGAEHSSAHDEEFDRLFRQRLAQVYAALDLGVPPELSLPILKAAGGADEPIGWGAPTVDGIVTDYFEWLYAGRMECALGYSAMAPGEDVVRRVWWTCDATTWYVRLDGVSVARDPPVTVTLSVDEPALRIELTLGCGAAEGVWRSRKADGGWNEPRPIRALAVRRIVELGIPMEDAGLRHGASLTGRLQVRQGDVVVQTCPRTGAFTVTLPETSHEETHWMA